MATLSHPYRPTPSLLAVCVLLLSGHAAAQTPSKGVYRIPYADGTDIKVTNDHIKHDPPGRIDMSGKGGGPYRIVAAADGIVRHVVDGFDKRISGCKDLAASEKKNNYVWIEHPNGEWTKYTHMTKGSSSGKAKLKVGQSVTAGTYLGDEGDVGCASGDHLHFEVGVPKASGGISTVGGFLTDNDGSKRNRIPRICGIGGNYFVSGQSYQARKVPGNLKPGAKEVARHGVPARDYQCLFDQAVNAGYVLEWIDGFDVGGNVYYNAVFRPKGNAGWAAFHGLTAAQHQQRFNEYTGKGYRPHQVESYLGQGGVRYAAIYRKQSGPAYSAYHGLDANAHQARMDALTKDGYRPRNVSVVSSGGQRRYTALYEKADIGSWQAKSQLSAGEYQQAFNSNAQQGRQVVYLNAYVHGGQPYFSAIWSSKANGPYKARHGLSSDQYQSEWQGNTSAGLLTRDVTGYSSGGSARYAAIWRK
ncbi:peptidoglycan DD-metalloendopeptidase family protein [Pseudoxanthomonas wuyuanensis]|uniref:Peptidase family M23 n=1 Tax=Pseudoxanthomonas wuyuanensis TaxID=1073196 RepID=A0A286CZP8_9GAMM|nr:peptidoglycan DD-metalloendopeptidase family protein [Pseudoxanthomonas wuyuanensis]KAF1722392.1 M23 family peptidase [Pseudoxanthomonas wuyuanensis]SOD51891.1 Peptidase family M23 [Pseudoxanthomonas wuyuanensis]